MTSPSSPEGSGLIERLTQAKTWQREDLTALCFEAASALSAYEGRLEEAETLIRAAYNEIHCIDDTPLDGDLVQMIAALGNTRDAERNRAQSAEARLETARKALAEISRMRTFPEDKTNTFTLAMAHKIALTALEQSGEGLGSSRAHFASSPPAAVKSDTQQILGKED